MLCRVQGGKRQLTLYAPLTCKLAAVVQSATDPLREPARHLLFSARCCSSPWCTWARPPPLLAFPQRRSSCPRPPPPSMPCRVPPPTVDAPDTLPAPADSKDAPSADPPAMDLEAYSLCLGPLGQLAEARRTSPTAATASSSPRSLGPSASPGWPRHWRSHTRTPRPRRCISLPPRSRRRRPLACAAAARPWTGARGREVARRPAVPGDVAPAPVRRRAAVPVRPLPRQRCSSQAPRPQLCRSPTPNTSIPDFAPFPKICFSGAAVFGLLLEIFDVGRSHLSLKYFF